MAFSLSASLALSSRLGMEPRPMGQTHWAPKPYLLERVKIEVHHFHQNESAPAWKTPNSSLSLERRPFQFFMQRREYSTNIHARIKMTAEDSNTFKLSLPLPGSGDCVFFLRGDQTVKNFVDDLQAEDASVDSVSVLIGSSKVSASTQLSHVFRSDFTVQINKKLYEVVPSSVKVAPPVPVSVLDDHEHPHVERLKQDIIPLLAEKLRLDSKAATHANLIMYGGLGFLVAQWCLMARLTWWEFNWDIMEPVTYFITFGTAVIGYAYFAFQKRDYSFVDLRESILLRKMLKEYTKAKFDVDRYFALEYKLNQLDPVALTSLKHALTEAQYNPKERVEAAKQVAESAAEQPHAKPAPKQMAPDIKEAKH